MEKINMIYTIFLSGYTRKQLDLLDSKTKERCLKIFDALKINPYLGKKLSGSMEGSWVVRAWPFRVIYNILKKEVCVHVIDIGHRKDVYR